MRKFITIIIFAFYCLKSSAELPKNYFFELRPFAGSVAAHRTGMEHLEKDPVRGIELNLYYKTTDNNTFNKLYNFPKIGFGSHYNYLGHPTVLGEAYSMYSFMQFGFADVGNRLQFNTRLAMGAAYLTKKFDLENNFENIAISTNINIKVKLDLMLNYSPKNSSFLYNVSLGLIHYSNGAVLKPNKGLNQIVASAGVAYSINPWNDYDLAKIEYTRTEYDEHEFWGMATLSTSDDYAYGNVGNGGGFFCSTVSLGYNRRYSAIGKYGIAIDAFYNDNFNHYFDTNWDTLIIITEKRTDAIRAGISFSHEFVYNRLSLVTGLGFYFYNHIKRNEPAYMRTGLRYYIFDYIFINGTIKTYGFKAYYIESGIGFSISR